MQSTKNLLKEYGISKDLSGLQLSVLTHEKEVLRTNLDGTHDTVIENRAIEEYYKQNLFIMGKSLAAFIRRGFKTDATTKVKIQI